MAIISLYIFLFATLLQSCKSIPKADFFPSGNSSGDSIVPVADDSFAGPVRLSPAFPFFGVQHDKLWVNNNGAVSFQAGITTYTPVCGAMGPQSKMITPFWGDVDTRRGGDIFYRQSNDPTLIAKTNDQIRRAYPHLPFVNVNWLFISTWDNVAFYGPSCNGVEGGSNRNTFQTILATDGTRSFTIFYYDQLTWTTGTASQGNCQGLGGTPAKAGFDVGDGQTFFELPGSCTPNVLNISSDSNVREPGVWVFRIDNTLDPPPSTEAPTTTTELPTTQPATTEETSTIVTSESPEMTCPPQPECLAANPCGNLIQEVIQHVINFVNTFPTTCLGNLNPCPNTNVDIPVVNMLARMLGNNLVRTTQSKSASAPIPIYPNKYE